MIATRAFPGLAGACVVVGHYDPCGVSSGGCIPTANGDIKARLRTAAQQVGSAVGLDVERVLGLGQGSEVFRTGCWMVL